MGPCSESPRKEDSQCLLGSGAAAAGMSDMGSGV